MSVQRSVWLAGAFTLAAAPVASLGCAGCWCIAGKGGSCPAEPVSYTEEFKTRLDASVLTNPMKLSCNPYTDADCQTSPPLDLSPEGADKVCAIVSEDDRCHYSLETYPTAAAAVAAGGRVTHTGACGLCSSQQDLASYMRVFDMTKAGKKCALKALVSETWGLNCFRGLGLTEGCSLIWVMNALYDSKHCKATCFRHLFSHYNGPAPTCKLNDCLECDEDNAGPLFKKFARRTRRSSGLASAIARPCDSIAHIEHRSCATRSFHGQALNEIQMMDMSELSDIVA